MRKTKNNLYCTNCGKRGHDYKNCGDPVTSLGIILLKFDGILNNNHFVLEGNNNIVASSGIRANDNRDLNLYSEIKYDVKFLMIRRKHTLGYIEFIRGRYKTDNFDGIIFLFQQMTKSEIEKIGKFSFDELWNDFWGKSEKKKNMEHEYIKSKEKFNMLKNDKTPLGLSFYVLNVKPGLNEGEWGFPKGRRNRNESDIECAKREFQEETGMNSDDYSVINSLEPLTEEFIGTNGVKYRHIYFIAKAENDKQPKVDENNVIQNTEVGGIDYFTYFDGIRLIRHHHIHRKNMLTRLYNFIMNHVIINMNK
ncbi:NUDIX hydrolase [Catovirus CTV1]|uniref:NUDIX hydrolase n=1 Tax=Catovirus CTV1 TaxID=1977631 RepID=A0A1V0SC02_9VIRU|nr:NUDIX hydrolase [Catovirus CTV1]